MEKNDVLAPLFKARSELTRRVVELSPTDDRSRANLHRLLEERDSLNAAINTLILSEFQAINSPELRAALDKLRELGQALSELQCTLATVNTAIQIAGTILDVAAKVVGLIATI